MGKKTTNLFTISKTIKIYTLPPSKSKVWICNNWNSFNHKANLKRYVLRLLLKVCKFGISRSSRGRAFRNFSWTQPIEPYRLRPTKTPLRNWLLQHDYSNSLTCQIWVNSPGVKFIKTVTREPCVPAWIRRGWVSEWYPRKERERKICLRLFAFFIKPEIGHFHVVVLQWRKRNVQ